MTDYVVICKISEDERYAFDHMLGDYVRATRQLFPSQSAARRYAATVAHTREPRVVTITAYLTEVEDWRRADARWNFEG